MSQTEVQLIKDAVIVNADISNSAAIDVSKISGVMPLAGGTFTNDVTFEGTTSGRNIVFDRSENALNFADSATARFGDSDELQIYHDGTNAFLVNTTGDFLFRNSAGNEIKIQAVSGEQSIVANANGSVDLYHDNSKKLETTSYGALLSGAFAATGNIDCSSDTAKIRVGGAQDLQIFHDGTDSFIHGTTSTRQLKIRGQEVRVVNEANSEIMAKFIQDGAVELYHNNTLRLETRANDVKFHGGLVAIDNVKLQLGSSGDLQLYHDGSHSYVDNSSGVGILRIRGVGSGSNGVQLQAKAGELSIDTIPHGQVELYYDNSKKFETTANGVKVNNRFELRNGTIFDNTANGNNCGLSFNGDGIRPTSGSGADIDNARDLGQTSFRWRNVYAGGAYYGNGANLTNVHKSYAILLEKLGDTDVGTFTAGAYRTRNLNTELEDPDGIVSLSSNQFTLQAGTYIIRWSCSAFQVDHHSTRIAHISGSFSNGGTEVGTSEYSNNGSEVTNRSVGVSLQVPTNANVYEIQHRCTTTIGGNGFGVRTMFGADTIATIVEIFKIA